VVLVLEAGVLADAEGVGCVASDGLLAEDMLWALHHCGLAHALQCIRPVRRLLCTHINTTVSMCPSPSTQAGHTCVRMPGGSVCNPSHASTGQSESMVSQHEVWAGERKCLKDLCICTGQSVRSNNTRCMMRQTNPDCIGFSIISAGRHSGFGTAETRSA